MIIRWRHRIRWEEAASGSAAHGGQLGKHSQNRFHVCMPRTYEFALLHRESKDYKALMCYVSVNTIAYAWWQLCIL